MEFDYDKIKDMKYDPSRGRYVGNDGSDLKVTPYSDGRGYKYDYYSSSTMNNAKHNSTHIKSDLSGNWTRVDNDRDNNSKTESSGSGCYLTTACMKHYMDEFDDNCYYLDMLRWFRDNYVSLEDKETYYKIATKVVEVLNRLDNSNELYNDIYKDIIQVCARLIEYGKYKETYNIYKNSILELENKYVKN